MMIFAACLRRFVFLRHYADTRLMPMILLMSAEAGYADIAATHADADFSRRDTPCRRH